MKKMIRLLLAFLTLSLLVNSMAFAADAVQAGESKAMDDLLKSITKNDTNILQPTSPPAVTDEPYQGILTPGAAAPALPEGLDTVDLTEMGSNFVFGVISNMMMNPDDYLGRRLVLKGTATQTTIEIMGETFYAVIIADAKACCAQGIEYVLQDGASYPKEGAQIIVSGIFETYKENDMDFYRLAVDQITDLSAPAAP